MPLRCPLDKVFEEVKRAMGQKWEGVELVGTVCEKLSPPPHSVQDN